MAGRTGRCSAKLFPGFDWNVRTDWRIRFWEEDYVCDIQNILLLFLHSKYLKFLIKCIFLQFQYPAHYKSISHEISKRHVYSKVTLMITLPGCCTVIINHPSCFYIAYNPIFLLYSQTGQNQRTQWLCQLTRCAYSSS